MDAEDEADAEDFKNAAHECAAERGQMGRLAFAGKYGTNADEQQRLRQVRVRQEPGAAPVGGSET